MATVPVYHPHSKMAFSNQKLGIIFFAARNTYKNVSTSPMARTTARGSRYCATAESLMDDMPQTISRSVNVPLKCPTARGLKCLKVPVPLSSATITIPAMNAQQNTGRSSDGTKCLTALLSPQPPSTDPSTAQRLSVRESIDIEDVVTSPRDSCLSAGTRPVRSSLGKSLKSVRNEVHPLTVPILINSSPSSTAQMMPTVAEVMAIESMSS